MGLSAADSARLSHILALFAQAVAQEVAATHRALKSSEGLMPALQKLMQRTHRIRHRLIWLVLAPLLVMLVAVAILGRPKWPVVETLPGPLESAEEDL